MVSILKRANIFMAMILAVIMATMCVSCSVEDNSSTGATNAQEQEFLTTAKQSKTALDTLGDEIYSCWYNAIYKDSYGGNINTAISTAFRNCADEVTLIELNDIKLKSLYKTVKDGDLSYEIKELMTAYTDYYEFVYNVSGSFNSFSGSKESLKKEFASAVKKLELEI